MEVELNILFPPSIFVRRFVFFHIIFKFYRMGIWGQKKNKCVLLICNTVHWSNIYNGQQNYLPYDLCWVQQLKTYKGHDTVFRHVMPCSIVFPLKCHRELVCSVSTKIFVQKFALLHIAFKFLSNCYDVKPSILSEESK